LGAREGSWLRALAVVLIDARIVDLAMASNRKSPGMRLEEFPADELDHLITFYPYIRYELAETGEFTDAALPEAQGTQQQLHALRELQASGELMIRISGAGNLNVWARERGGVSDDDGQTYLSVVRFPSLARMRAVATDGVDPLEHRWRMRLRPADFEYPLRWNGHRLEVDREKEANLKRERERDKLPELERAQRGITDIIAAGLPDAGDEVVARITARALHELQALMAESGLGDPDLTDKAAYRVARCIAGEIPNIDQARARGAGLAVADQLFDLFPESL
jgi:hypothetical protein